MGIAGWSLGVPLIGLVLSCAAREPAPPRKASTMVTTPRVVAERDQRDLLAAERDRILAMHAPRYSGSGEHLDTIRFLERDLGTWLTRRKHVTDLRRVEDVPRLRSGCCGRMPRGRPRGTGSNAL